MADTNRTNEVGVSKATARPSPGLAAQTDGIRDTKRQAACGIHHDAHPGGRLRHLEADVREGRPWSEKISQVAPDLQRTGGPNEVFIQIEFASADEAKLGRDRLIASKVLDRFRDKTGPTVVEEADA